MQIRIYENHSKLDAVTTPKKPFGVQVFDDCGVLMWDAFKTYDEAMAAAKKFIADHS